MEPATVDINPFTHLSEGFKSLWATNFWAAVGATLLAFVAMVVCFIPAWIAAATGNAALLVGLGLLGVAVMIPLLGILGLASAALVLHGSRDQKLSFGDAIKLAKERFGLAVVTILILIGLFVAGAIVVGVLAKLLPVLGVLAALAAAVVLILAILNLYYLDLVLVDSGRPAGVKAAIETSRAVWRRSIGATLLMLLTTLVISLIFSAIFGTAVGTKKDITANYSTGQLQTDTTTKISPLGIVDNLLQVPLGLFIAAGSAHIYNQARGELGAKKPEDTPAQPPVAAAGA